MAITLVLFLCALLWPSFIVGQPLDIVANSTRDILGRDDTCSYHEVAPKGDSCWSIATNDCKISLDDFYKYNTGGVDSTIYCNNLMPGDHVCCGPGSPPDFSPQKNADGSCSTYMVQPGDGCGAIAGKVGIKDWHKIDDYNKNTWGWPGCDAGPQRDSIICVSEGDPPFPLSNPAAICGPTVNGTQKPTDGTDWAKLNPCPLNVCCDTWGQCGATSEFCVDTRDKATMSPGTAAKDTNGCISNCGTVVTNLKAPASFAKVGYFEAWNFNRPCLNMDVSKMANGYYTHVHWAFANITNDFQVDISGQQEQFDGLKKLTGVKRIVSFGGWAFSTDPATAHIFREGVAQPNRNVLVANIVKFVTDNGLDGVDFDWEYPGATDILGAGSGSKADGPNYAGFLAALKLSLPAGTTVSIAAPSSYWYLRNFPIKIISYIVDYIVYMTYDLHGQWDYGKQFSNPGCPTGNCLRSHVNLTETMWSLAMITKAGVTTDKVFVGMARYGRSFNMADASCTSENCLFTGTAQISDAEPGDCTATPGYISNYEIERIMNGDEDLYKRDYTRVDSFAGDAIVYDNNYVSYMTNATYEARKTTWQLLQFGGISDWAADLQTEYGPSGVSFDGDDGDDADGGYYPQCPWNQHYNSLDELNNAITGMPLICAQYFTLDILRKMVLDAQDAYNSANNDYQDKFNAYVRYIKQMIPSAVDTFMQPDPTTHKSQGLSYFTCVMGKGKSQPCSNIPYNTLEDGTYDMTLTVNNETEFMAALVKATGVSPTLIDLKGTYDWTLPCIVVSQGAPCPFGSGHRTWHGYPGLAKGATIPNPKDIITNSVGSLGSLLDMITLQQVELMTGSWWGKFDDVVQSSSLAVFLVQQAIDSMKQVQVLGAQEEASEAKEAKQKKINLILEIIGAVLFVVPFIGEAAEALTGIEELASIALLVSEGGAVGIGMYDFVKDPTLGLMDLVGAMFGIRGITQVLRDADGFAKLGVEARALRAGKNGGEGIGAKLGGSFKKNDDLVQSISGVCKRA